ncbi:orf119-like protein [Peridroma alphabaculovirus]|uniref:Orf119-like protein n=1 Tax=Peridroma alphabaculovirus TaxID=1346829 RepID=A0A068LRG8_9ABAC|nr:orf119-like protein [Peridroma alphabaculovirus]AIE47785.1 orf119-like protein [Peridroma alphabaculovirus]
MTDSKNIFVVIRNDIKNLHDDVRDVNAQGKLASASLKVIENRVDDMPFAALLNAGDALDKSVKGIDTKLDSSLAQLSSLDDQIALQLADLIAGLQLMQGNGDKRFDGVAAQLKESATQLLNTDARINAINTNINTFTAQLGSYQKDNNAKLDALSTTLTNQLNAFQKDTKSTLDGVLTRLTAITNILRPLG